MKDATETRPLVEELVIGPTPVFRHYWRDLWRYRELFVMLSWRDVAVRYKQTVAGAGWAIVQPFLSMVIMTVIFSRVAGLPSTGGAPYPIMIFAAMLPWQFFSTALATSSQSVLNNAGLVSKVYFPRLIIPATPILVALVDLVLSAAVLFGLMTWYQFWPTWRIALLPLLVVMTAVATLGPSLILSALTVRYRDFRFVIPFLVQFGLYVSPVAYDTGVVRAKLGDGLFLLYSLNPMVGVIDGFRWALLRSQAPFYWPGFLLSTSLSVVLFVIGIYYFRGTERQFADLV